MIYHLLQAITSRLQAELKNQVPKAKRHWGIAPASEPAAASLPLVTLYAGASDSRVQQPLPQLAEEKGDAIATVTQELAQTFSIEIHAKAPDELEAIATLVLATVLTSQLSLLEAFNNSEKTTYQGQTVRTSHRLRQLKFLSVTPAYFEKSVATTLAFSTTGYIILDQLLEETVYTIKEIKGLEEGEIKLTQSPS